MKKVIKITFYSVLLACLFFVASCTRKIYKITFEENGGTLVSDIEIPINETPIMPENPVKEGYSFVGWFTDSSLTQQYTVTKAQGDLTLYAKWQVNNYIISFETNGGSNISNVNFDFGSTIVLPEDPEKVGHALEGWYTDSALTEKFTLTTMPAYNLTLYAKWEADKISVRFISDDAEYSRETVSYGQTVAMPEQPEKIGHTFLGWYYDNKAYNFDSAVTSSINIVAKWQINQYTITYDTDGGSAIEAETYDYYAPIERPEIPTKDGYIFVGWTLDGNPFTFDNAKMPAEDITVKALFQVGDYTVRFNKNSASATGVMNDFVVEYDNASALPTNAYSLTGYAFKEWNTAADGTGTSYADQAEVKNLATSGIVDLYAIWTANTYNVVFNANGGEGSMASQEFVYDQAESLSQNTFTKQGYSFAGWATSATSNVVYADQASVGNLVAEGEITLYAKWTANKYNVVFNSNGGEGSMAPQEFVYDESQKLSAVSFTKEGHSFAGWATSANGEVVYSDLENVNNLSTSNDVTLYAKWNVESYNFVVVYGSNDYESVKVPYGTQLTEPTEIPEISGSRFDYWMVYGTEEVFSFENATMPAKDLIIVAVYENQVIVTYVPNLSNVTINPSIGFEGQALQVPSVPQIDGYNFKGWYSDEQLSVPFTFETFPAANINVYAAFEGINYTISFDSNGGKKNMEDIPAVYGTTLVPENSFEKDGYTFKCWNTEKDGSGTDYYKNSKNLTTVEGKVVTLYAQWTPNTYNVVFDANGGNGSMASQKLTYDNEENLDKIQFSKLGYSFAGWATSANGEVVYADESLAVNLSTKQDVTLYAKWTANTYKIHFNTNDANIDIAQQSMTYDVSAPLATPSKMEFEGHTFKEWNTAADGKGTSYSNDAVVVNLTDVKDGIFTLYAIWEKNSYTFSFYSSKDHSVDSLISTKQYVYGSVYSTLENIPSTYKLGHEFGGWYTFDGQLVDLSSSTLKVTSDLEIYQLQTPITYTVEFRDENGELIYSVERAYGEELSFNEFIEKLNADSALITQFHNIVSEAGKDAMMGSNSKVEALYLILKGYDTATIDLNAVYAIDSSINVETNKLVSAIETGGDAVGALTGLNGYIEAVKIDINNKIALYAANGNNPSKENSVFGGWVLGADTVYENNKPGSLFTGYVPASLTGGAAKIIPSWIGVSTVTPSLVEGSENTISWANVDVSSFESQGTVETKYSIYHYNEATGKHNYLDTTSSNVYTFNTTDLNKEPYFAPGTYKVVVVAIVSIKKSDGTTVVYTSEYNKEPLNVNIATKESNLEVESEGDYYSKGTEDGYSTFYFYTNMKYEFASSNEFQFYYPNDNISDYGDIVKLNGNIIETGNAEGTFFFTSSKDNHATKYQAKIYPYVSSFTLGESLQQFNSLNPKDNTKPNNSAYLDKTTKVYKIGVSQSGVDTDYEENGFAFDLSVLTTGGINVEYLGRLDYFIYKFYKVGTDGSETLVADTSNNEIGTSAIGSYDYMTGAWKFTAAAGGTYRVEISIKDVYVPKALRGTIVTSQSFTFQLNNCINVFTHEKLQSIYGNTNLRNGINIHANIQAKLNANQLYDSSIDSPFDSLAKDHIKAEGTPINLEPVVYMNTGQINSPTGHVYLRVSLTDLAETNYEINGNLFTIDGSKLPYSSIYSFDNLSSVSGYEISNSQVSIFTYYASNYAERVSSSVITYNDLTIVGNTSNYSATTTDIESPIELMNKNSGGYNGIVTMFGARVNLENVHIKNTNVATSTSYGSSIYANKFYSLANWSNSMYGFDVKVMDIRNSHIKDSGGSAIHIDDAYSILQSGEIKRRPMELNISKDTIIENYISGEEGYFKAMGMEIAIMQFKASLDQLCRVHSGNKSTLIYDVTNPITGLTTQKLNLVALMLPAGENTSTGLQTNLVKINIGDTTDDTKLGNSKASISTDFYDLYQNYGVSYGGSTVGYAATVGLNKNSDQTEYTDGYFVTGIEVPIYGKSAVIFGYNPAK